MTKAIEVISNEQFTSVVFRIKEDLESFESLRKTDNKEAFRKVGRYIADFEKLVGDLLRIRGASHQNTAMAKRFPKEYHAKYQAILAKLKYPKNTGALGMFKGWHFVVLSLPFQAAFEQRGEFEVKHKQYFTFYNPKVKDDPAKNFIPIQLFLESLPNLATKLYKFCEKNKVKVTFKVPDSLDFFLGHVDSLVVYYNDAKFAAKIRRTVEGFYRWKTSFKFVSGIRSKEGFDLNHTKDERLNMSHASLIAKMVAQDLILSTPDIKNIKKLISWIKTKIKRYNTMSIDDAYDRVIMHGEMLKQSFRD